MPRNSRNGSKAKENPDVKAYTALSACLLLASVSASAQIYTWVDDEGVTHYSDQPLAEEARRTDIDSGDTNADAARANLAASIALRDEQSKRFYEQRSGDDAAAALTPEQLEYHRKSCEAARTKMNEFAQARRLYKLADDGSKIYLEEDEILAARAEVQSAITEHCQYGG